MLGLMIFLFWLILAVIYATLSIKTCKKYREVKRFSGVRITENGIVIGEGHGLPESREAIDIANYFRGILWTDFIGFLLAAFAAFLTGYTLLG